MNIHQISKIDLSPENVECIVFWTKNPKNILAYLDLLDSYNYKYYFQFTVTSYGSDIEINIPRKEKIIETFIQLSKKIGKEKVIWRYDPIFITDKINLDYHYTYFEYLIRKLNDYTEKCVISFLDLYKKCQSNLKMINLKELSNEDKINIANKLKNIASKYNIEIQTCAEDIELMDIGIPHGKCIDDNLISKILRKDIEVRKDKTQREVCGCIESIDIGSYNTCNHNCLYCYANFSRINVERNIKNHDAKSPLLYGTIEERDKITTRKGVSCARAERRLFD
jgi:DNA repair photolyase